MYMQMCCVMLHSELCNYGVGFGVLTEKLLTLMHNIYIYIYIHIYICVCNRAVCVYVNVCTYINLH